MAQGISSRAPNRPSPGDFAAPAPKKRPSRAPRSPFFAGSGQNWCRRTQAEPGALGGAWGAGTSEKGAWARPGGDPRAFSRRFLTLFPRISPARSPSSRHSLPFSRQTPSRSPRRSTPCRRRSTPCRARRQPRLAPWPSRSRGSRGRRHRSHRACRTPSGGWKFSGAKQSPPTGGTGP